mmetsp:Transcript_9094/g.16974  ORF Transcript_9094/g.16974 Transcript_9094/m.16974 type:complete len:90 (-) Transcript_9094:166-435(-)
MRLSASASSHTCHPPLFFPHAHPRRGPQLRTPRAATHCLTLYNYGCRRRRGSDTTENTGLARVLGDFENTSSVTAGETLLSLQCIAIDV